MQAKPARGAALVRTTPREPVRMTALSQPHEQPDEPAQCAPQERAATTPTEPVRMTAIERRATLGLAGIFALRMLGMFIILPVFALHAETLPGSNYTLVGIALGAYGLTQALLQVPFGWASDRWGRKPAIATGLVVFALGSFLAAWAPDIVWTIIGRALQGSGAISAAVIALTADLTRDEVRTKAMAAIGMTIGTTFALSLVLGPVLQHAIGVPGIFALTGVLALAAIGVLDRLVPSAEGSASAPSDPGFAAFRQVLGNGQLLRLNYGIFALHAVLMALFVQVPFALRDGGLAPARHWQVYLPVMLASVALMLPALRFADRPPQVKVIVNGAVVVLALAQLMLAFAGPRVYSLGVALMVFFAAFNLLEAMLPSLVSKFAPAGQKGAALGVYSSVQFLGTFVGAAAGGVLAQHAGPAAVFGFGVALTLLWLAASATMSAPPSYRSDYSMGET